MEVKTAKTISSIVNENWSIKKWETNLNLAAKRLMNPGYVAALQRIIASRAKCLVLVGGEHFQSIARNEYLQNHPNESDQCIHYICASRYMTGV